MQIGMIGLGRMGANMVRRLLKEHQCVVFDKSSDAVRLLTATSLTKDPTLAAFSGSVSDSGEGRWTIKAAIDANVPTPVLSTALYSRFSSRGEAEFADRLTSSMRFEFGGHVEKSTDV